MDCTPKKTERKIDLHSDEQMDGRTDGHTCTIDQQKLKLTMAKYKMKTVINSTKQGPHEKSKVTSFW